MNASCEWWQTAAADIDTQARAAAEARQAVLTKPPGALGRREAVAIRLAGLQGREKPVVDKVEIVVYAADHGADAEEVRVYPCGGSVLESEGCLVAERARSGDRSHDEI